MDPDVEKEPSLSLAVADKSSVAAPAALAATSHADVPRQPAQRQQQQPGSGNDISLRAVAPVDVQVRGLSVAVDISPNGALPLLRSLLPRHHDSATSAAGHTQKQWKTILADVGADMAAGSLTAIIGGSGSGKTTLLNVVAERMRGRRLRVDGHTLFNGRRVGGLAATRSAYVMQHDVLEPTLTVRETLRYAADLRLPDAVGAAERSRIVEEVILELGLKEAADTRIGNHAHKGCSGGEKRRTSIGVQLLANPSVLFLDEPTTGLDATSAYQLVRTLKNLAGKGRTIITTIHQPRSEIWNLFDNLILLARGAPAYSGPASECLSYFADLGHPLPPFVNPAEHLIDIVAVDIRSPALEEASTARVERIKEAWRAKSSTLFTSNAISARSKEQDGLTTISSDSGNSNSNSSSKPNNHTTFARQTAVLTRRTWTTTLRDPMGMAGSLVEAISMAIITGYIFYQLGSDSAGIRSRQGALYTASALQGYLILLYEVYRLTIDIGVFDRERSEGVVGVAAFLASRRLARVLVEDVPVPALFSVIFYFMAGFRNDAGQFFTFFAVMLLEQYIAVCFAMTCVAVSRHFAGASLVANMAYTLQSMACGYFIQSNSIPVYVRWTKWIAYVYYAFGALISNEFINHTYACPSPDPSSPVCAQYTGAYIVTSLGFPTHEWVWRPIIILLAFAIAFYMGAGVILAFWRAELGISRQRTEDQGDESAGKEVMVSRSKEEVRSVGIKLEGFGLEVEKRAWFKGRAKGRRVRVLRPLDAAFEPGVLNVVMGPSGSGKTSLLNAMGKRLRNDWLTRYHAEGCMLVNGTVPAEGVVEAVVSYVTQDDDALLSSLTVRETLRFAAGLRLPAWMSTAEKHARADSILLKMGLRDCADNLIGSDQVKGISGGEKRRVSIAVQILTDPRVLLLDEPTSGLDAFTAASIVEVLGGLAEEGRTLVLTIHQSRSDLFARFGNVLLLARGGSAVYAGPGEGMLAHFAGLGFECPRTTNPADFALDLITVDLQQAEREAASRAKVQRLIEAWSQKTAATPSSTAAERDAATQTQAQAQAQTSLPAELGALARGPAPFRSAYPLLLHRAGLNIRRQPPLMLARTMQVLGLGLILALFFAPLKHAQSSVQNRLGFIQEIAPIYFVGMLQNVAAYPAERAVFYREHDDGAYGVGAFFAAYTTLEAPFEAVTALLFAVLADLAVGLPRTVDVFFVVVLNCFCVVSCGESLGIVFNTLVPHTGFAVNVTSVFLSVAQIMGGIMSLDMPPFLQAMNFLSPVKYVVGSLAPWTLDGVRFSCERHERLPSGACPIESGEQVLSLYGLRGDKRLYLVWLAVCTVVYRGVAFLVLKAVRERWGGGRRGRAGA